MYAYKKDATVNTLDCFAIARNDAKHCTAGKTVILRALARRISRKEIFRFAQDDIALHRGISPTRHCETRSVEAIQVRDTSGSVLSMTNRKKKAAFTLAEVLITLGIIGIVAAMTLPVIIQDTKNKELEAQFKKGYSSLQQAILRANYEGEDLNSLYSGGYITSHQEGKHLHEIIGKQFVNSKIEDSSPAHLIQAIKGFSGKDVNTSTALVTCAWDDGYILAAGQMSIYFETVLDIYITIDTNGGTGPNRLGYDVFMFVLGKHDKLIPMGSPESAQYRFGVQGFPDDMSDLDLSCSQTSNAQYNGLGCAYPALTDPNYFKNLP